ncbi:sensor histidine kinase [Acidihalobacter prosperus]|uniref:sensor histidine kinase n=1 Tax=Acidihalobacter prosperus TaxID=160660 RepID=UPI0005714920|nr:ATP-binding protein [Acidihalobacter prosperus]
MRPRRLLHSTGFRTGLGYAALFAASVFVLFGVIYWQTAGYMERQLRAVTVTDFHTLESVLRHGGVEGLRRAIAARTRGEHGHGGWFLLLNDQGTRLAGNLPPGVRPREGWQQLALRGSGDHAGEGESGEHRVVQGEGRALGRDLFLFVGQDAGALNEMRELWLSALAWGVGATLLLAALGGAFMGAAALRRVEAINRVAGDIVAGDLARRMPVRGTEDEFDTLATHLNRMLARIQELMEGMRQVSNDIAHDLRTPLGRLRLTLETARRDAGSVADYRLAVDHALEQTDQILETFAALLRIAQIESGARRSRFQRVDLSAVLDTVLDAYLPVAEDAGHILHARIPPGIHVRGDRELLVQAFANLIENALRHTPAGSRIDLALETGPQGVTATVADDGPGIPAEALDKVTGRFYRLESSRSTPGSGLGLSLVAAIAALHEAELRLADNAPGLRATLQFAAAETAPAS